MLDKAKLAKIMAMTTSDKDGEVLAAIKLANAMLVREGQTWGDIFAAIGPPALSIVLQRTPYKAEEDWVAPHLKDKVIIDLMFKTVYAQPRTGNEDFWQFMDSIHHRWESYQNLSQGQYEALRRSYNRVAKRPA